MKLESQSTDKIKQLCQQGYALYDQADFAGAIRLFYQAWILLPKPQTDFAEAGWILSALGDGYYRNSQLPQALEALTSALFCPGMKNNPFILLRQGQCHFAMDDLASARALLFKAYRAGGDKLFQRAEAKHIDAIADLIKPKQPATKKHEAKT